VQFAVDSDVFRALPRHPDWSYDWLDGQARLSYRPRPLPLVRGLGRVPRRPTRVSIEPAEDRDRRDLLALVAGVWGALDPFRAGSLAAAPRFARTLDGRDDPWDPGVLVARPADGSPSQAVGLVALNAWRPAGAPATALAEPGLCWLTVAPGWRHEGVATALLAAAVEAARHTGAGELHSAVSVANTAAVAWHWVNGFTPLRTNA
jgi:GNAT superfamily N-acetyltransferase